MTLYCTSVDKIIGRKPLPPGNNVGASELGHGRCVRIRLLALRQNQHNIVSGGEGIHTNNLVDACTKKGGVEMVNPKQS